MSTKLLIVEDDPNLGQILTEYLELKGFQPTLATDGEEGLKIFKSDEFGLCILDIMMPRKDGFSLAKDIAELKPGLPFIFLTAKAMKADTLEGLKIGADDYMTKPFSMEELLLRIQAILRRSGNGQGVAQQDTYSIGQFTFDPTNRKLDREGETTRLTTKESELLCLLCEKIGSPVDRSMALTKIWKDDTYFNARSMDVYIAKLRKHLKPDPSIEILTLHGQGFQLVENN